MQRELLAAKTEDSRIAYVYTIEQANGTPRFMVDSDFGIPDAERQGNAELELSPQMPSLANSSGATDVYTDGWGTDFTGYAPIRDGKGPVFAVFRIDMRM